MSSLFTSLVAISPLAGRVAGEGAVPGASPSVKGLSSGRQTAPTGQAQLGHQLSVDTRFLWKLDEGLAGDDILDASGNGYVLDYLTGGLISVQPGQIGYGRFFNDFSGAGYFRGLADAATVSKLVRTSGNWTLGFWMKIPTVDLTPTTHGVMTVCELNDPLEDVTTAVFYLRMSSGLLHMGSSAGGAASTGISFVGLGDQFVHCTLAWNGTTIQAWRNGVALSNPTIPAPTPTSLVNPAWVLGLANGDGLSGLPCVLDDVWFENVLWTTPQVLNDYLRGRGL